VCRQRQELRYIGRNHYGSIPIIEKTADGFVAEMAGHATKVIVPEKGKHPDDLSGSGAGL
jgi:hypothetical protein